MRATTSTCWSGPNERPAIIESAVVSSTVCGNWLESRFTASGGPDCLGSRTITNSGMDGGTAAPRAGASFTVTLTAAVDAPDAADAALVAGRDLFEQCLVDGGGLLTDDSEAAEGDGTGGEAHA